MPFNQHKLSFQIDADGKGARKELQDIDHLIGKVGAGIGTWAGPAGIAAAGVAAIGTAGIATGAALFNLSKQASDFGSTIFDASKKTGLGAESLSAMKFAADQSGTSLEAITGGVSKFAKTVGEAADGSDAAAAKLKEFGLAPQDAINDLDGALGRVFQRIIQAPPGIERITLAQKAFGKSGADLLPFLDSFDGDLAGLIRKAKELGVTIDDKAAAAADKFGDQLDTLSNQLTAAGRTIGTEFMKPFGSMAEDVSAWLASNKDEVSTWGIAFSVAMDNAYRNIKTVVDFVKDNEFWFRLTLGVAGNAALDHFAEQVRRRKAQQDQDQAGEVDFGTMTPAQRRALSPLGGARYGSGEDDQPGSESGKVVNAVGIGQATSQADFDRQRKAYLDNIADEARTAIANERQTMAERLEIRESEYGKMFSIAERYASDVGRTEADLERYRETLDTQLLDHRKELLQEYIDFLKQAGPEGVEELRSAEHRMKLLEDEIETARNKNATNEKKRVADAIDNERKLGAVRARSWSEYVAQIKAASDAQDELDAKNGRARYEAGTITGGTGIGAGIADGIGIDLVSMFDESTNAMLSFQERMALVGADINNFVGSSLGGMIEGLAQMGAAWLSTGQFSAEAALQMISSAAFSIATQAGFKAIFEYAEGMAALGVTWGVPNPSSIAHFAAATTYAGIAAIAGGVGVVAGLGARAAGGGSSGGGKGSSGYGKGNGTTRQEDLRPISRASDDAYLSGHRDTPAAMVVRAIEKLEKRMSKFDSMRPGDVLVAGARQRKGFIGTQAVDDMKTRPQLGSRLLRQTNAR